MVAYAIAGNLGINLTKDPIGKDKKGKPVYLKDVWPSNKEIAAVMKKCISAKLFRDRYSDVFKGDANWRKIKPAAGETYKWNAILHLCAEPALFHEHEKNPGRFQRRKGRARSGRIWRFHHDRSYQPGRFDQTEWSGGKISVGSQGHCRWISIPMARGAATMK